MAAENNKEELAQLVVCIDDTDDLSKQTSTGAVAEALANNVALFGGKVELDVTRHQLLLDPRVPYTSHNSAMAFVASFPPGMVKDYRNEARVIVQVMRAASSDPGLCMGVVPAATDPWLPKLYAYGRKAQREYVPQEEAFALAAKIPWLELEGLAGTNDGVVGALAGAALRLQGEDGRFRGRWVVDASGVRLANRSGRGNGTGKGGGSGKGKHKAAARKDNAGQAPVLLRELKEKLAAYLGCEAHVEGLYGASFDDDELVLPCLEAKPVLRHGTLTMLAAREDGCLRLLTKTDLDALDDAAKQARPCADFVFDNDVEELIASEFVKSCANCLYRRVLAGGFACMKEGVIS